MHPICLLKYVKTITRLCKTPSSKCLTNMTTFLTQRSMELKRYTCCFSKPGQLWLKVYGDLFIGNANWQMQTRAPDNEAHRLRSPDFIGLRGALQNLTTGLRPKVGVNSHIF